MLDNFVQCPVCASHGKMSEAAANILAALLWQFLDGLGDMKADPAVTELTNIRNHILNVMERKAPAIDELLL